MTHFSWGYERVRPCDVSEKNRKQTISQYHNYRIIIVDLKEFVTGKPHICWAKKV